LEKPLPCPRRGALLTLGILLEQEVRMTVSQKGKAMVLTCVPERAWFFSDMATISALCPA
jgi:hypothetical protein